MIRQAISCDICGAEKKQTNHWFVVCEQAGELRIAGWSSRNRLRGGSKHLCGQTCLHKLVDEFMARTIAGRAPAPMSEQPAASASLAHDDASLTSPAAYTDPDRSAPLAPAIAPQRPLPSAPALVAARPATVVPMSARLAESPAPAAVSFPMEDTPVYASRRWRAEAWERERNREMRAVERHPDILRRRKGF